MQIVSNGDSLHEMSNPVLETICMKCQILFSGNNKKNVINLSSDELAQREVKVKGQTVCPYQVAILLQDSPVILNITQRTVP